MARRTALRLFTLLALLVLPLAADPMVQGAATPDVPTYALVNARIVPVSTRPIPSGTLVLRGGQIVAIGPNVDPPADAIVMDADGWTLYPGFVDAHSSIGMPKPPTLPQDNTARARAIQTRQRAGEPTPGLTPQLEAVAEYSADRDALQAARNVGITSAAVVPSFGVFKEQSAIVTLRDGLLTDQVVRGQWAQHLGFQRLRGEYPGTLMGVMASIRQHYLDARWYREAWARYRTQPATIDRPAYNPALESLQSSAGGDQPVVFTAWTENEILRALRLADELGLDVIVSGAVEGWRATDALRAAGSPVLVSLDLRPRQGPVGFGGGTGTDPIDDPTTEDVEDAKANAGRLYSAGVTVAFTGAGLDDPDDFLQNFRAAVDAGLSRDGALRALTITPAEILGVSDVVGSLEVGKAANVVAVEGDIFDAESRVAAVWVDGTRYDAEADDDRRGRQTDDDNDDADDDEAPSRAERERRAPYGPLGGEVPVTAVRHGTILTAANGTISGGTVVIEDGTITAVGPDAEVVVPAGAREIDGIHRAATEASAPLFGEGDVHGERVTPGMINAGTSIGLTAQPADGDPYDAIFVAAKLLHDAGVPFAFRTGGASAARNLPDHAALGVAFGLPREAAWHALTRGAAEILGVGDLYGSVEEGMIANLVVSEGDLLDIPSQVKHVLIRGQEVSLETHHTRLWEQYGARPQPQQ